MIKLVVSFEKLLVNSDLSFFEVLVDVSELMIIFGLGLTEFCQVRSHAQQSFVL